MASTGETAPDGMTLIEVIRALEEAGYTAQLGAGPDGTVCCFACRTTSPATEVQVERLCRTEGPSDPADMVVVAAARCPRCAARGTLALKYGPGASPDEAEILGLLDDTARTRVPTD